MVLYLHGDITQVCFAPHFETEAFFQVVTGEVSLLVPGEAVELAAGAAISGALAHHNGAILILTHLLKSCFLLLFPTTSLANKADLAIF